MPTANEPHDQSIVSQDRAQTQYTTRATSYPVGVNLQDYISAFIRARWLVVVIVTLFGALAGVAAFMMTPVYQARVVMMPVDEQSQRGALADIAQSYAPLASLAGINLQSGGTSRAEFIATLRSRSFSEEFIRVENLLPILFADNWNSESGTWTDGNEPTMDDAFDRFDRSVRAITEDARTGLVTLTIEWRDPDQAASWANSLVNRINERMRQRAIKESEQTIRYLEDELKTASLLEIKQSIYRLIEARIRDKSLANVRSEYAFRVIDPATVSDLDNFVRPRRLAMIAVGIAAGLLVSFLVVFMRVAIAFR